MRASLFALALGVCPAVYGQSPSPSAQIGAVPPPPWSSVPAPAAAPTMPSAQAPAAIPMQAPVAPPAPAQAPTVLLVQVPSMAPVAMAAPAMTVPSAQSPLAQHGYVNPFVVTQSAPVVQQGVAQVALTPLTLVADNPWIVDRMLGRLGAWLHARGQPVLRFSMPTTPAPMPTVTPAASPVMMAPTTTTVPVIAKHPHCTAFGRWFFGE